MNVGNRSNYSLLPFPVRYRMAALMHDGATFEALCADSEIKAAYERIGAGLSRAALTGVRKCKEYREFVRQREEEMRAVRSDRLTRAITRELEVSGTIADSVQIELLRAVEDMTRNGAATDVKDAERLARMYRTLNDADANQKAARLQKQLDAERETVLALKSEIETLKKGHAEELARLTGEANVSVDPEKIADELKKALGVRKN